MIKYLTPLLLVPSLCFAEPKPTVPYLPEGAVLIPSKEISLAFEGRPVVTIFPDGRVKISPEYTPTEAARIFWKILVEQFPQMKKEICK